MSDDPDRPIQEGLKTMNVPAPDPRLSAWAAGTLPEPEQDDLRRQADTSPELAEHLDRLAPLDESMRNRFVDDALAALTEDEVTAPAAEPSSGARIIAFRPRRWVLASAAATAAAAAAAWLLVPSEPTYTLVNAPNVPLAAEAPLSVTVTMAGDERPPQVWVRTQTTLTRQEVPWDIAVGRATLALPAYVVSGGRFGTMDLFIVPPDRAMDGKEDLKAELANVDLRALSSGILHVPLQIAWPRYRVHEAVAVLSSRTRSDPASLNETELEVSPDMTSVQLRLRPSQTVAAPVKACAFVAVNEALRPVPDSCIVWKQGAGTLTLEVAALLPHRPSAVLVALTSPETSMTPDEVEQAERTPDTAVQGRVIRIPLVFAPSP